MTLVAYNWDHQLIPEFILHFFSFFLVCLFRAVPAAHGSPGPRSVEIMVVQSSYPFQHHVLCSFEKPAFSVFSWVITTDVERDRAKSQAKGVCVVEQWFTSQCVWLAIQSLLWPWSGTAHFSVCLCLWEVTWHQLNVLLKYTRGTSSLHTCYSIPKSKQGTVLFGMS